MSLNVEKYRNLILHEKARLGADRQNLRDSARTGEQVNELTNLDQNHPADSANEEFERAKDMALVAVLDAQLAQIEDALAQIEAGRATG